MTRLPLQRRTLALFAVIALLLSIFFYVALRSGPLAPVAVTTTPVTSRTLAPALFGIGTVEARYTYKIGPTAAGRVLRLAVQVGDRVTAGQILGEMDPVDLDDRVRAQASAMKRVEAVLREADARQAQASTQALRYERLFAVHLISDEVATTKRQESQVADAVQAAAREERARASSDLAATLAQRRHLRLIAPVNGVVAVRAADPGTTVVAGQPVVEVIDPDTLWINVRFDQISAAGLVAGLPAAILLRSHSGQSQAGTVLRVEPKADAVTEEILAKVVFDARPGRLPPIDELAEVTVALPGLRAAAVIPNVALRREGEAVGVWRVAQGTLQWVTVKVGAADLEGQVQVLEGLENGDQVIVYSEKVITANSRIKVVRQIAGARR